MTAAQLDAARRYARGYARARHDMTTTEPDTLARAAAELAADLARVAWWTARAEHMARSAKAHR